MRLLLLLLLLSLLRALEPGVLGARLLRHSGALHLLAVAHS